MSKFRIFTIHNHLPLPLSFCHTHAHKHNIQKTYKQQNAELFKLFP